MGRLRGLVPAASALVCFVVFASLSPALYDRPRPQPSPGMEVALPRSVQVLMAAGDRYLAANLAGFRALVVSTETMTADNYRILGLVQKDVAWLNPAHEDNYYIAAAILPWSQEVDAAQEILQRASEARPFDWSPAFYFAFNELHFRKNPVSGARWLQVAANHTRDEMDKIQLQQLAAQWIAKGEDRQLAIRMHRTLAKETHHAAFARFLERRAKRLERISLLEDAVSAYRSRVGRAPKHLGELVDDGILKQLPTDPFGAHYAMDSAGNVVVVKSNPVSSGNGK